MREGIPPVPERDVVYPPMPDLPDAACLDIHDPEIMHPDPRARGQWAAGALMVCKRCPADTKRSCLDYALAWPGEVSGAWGGVSETEINQHKRDRNKQRVLAGT
ncbi:WhiB family transcriptional regulator [Frankia sp. Cj3]|uniref:WhiB family transcriptional regulator n=1 Tax=Frankia sp. Cj3 TaxID=2880976 RepID=UPI001EF6A978|nr:WhiB family transcriptional regulator [Frankia sp. Cj3]